MAWVSRASYEAQPSDLSTGLCVGIFVIIRIVESIVDAEDKGIDMEEVAKPLKRQNMEWRGSDVIRFIDEANFHDVSP